MVAFAIIGAGIFYIHATWYGSVFIIAIVMMSDVSHAFSETRRSGLG